MAEVIVAVHGEEPCRESSTIGRLQESAPHSPIF